MEGIDQAIGDQPWREGEARHPDRTTVRARRFLADQPHVARFLNTRTRAFGNEPVGLAVRWLGHRLTMGRPPTRPVAPCLLVKTVRNSLA